MADSSSPKYIIRNMRTDDREKVLEICNNVNFTSGTYEYTTMLNVDPNGFFVAEEIDTGKLIGMCFGAVHSPSYAFLGSYGVLPEYRGKGIGQSLWGKVMAHFGNVNTGLCGREHMVPVYRNRCGFIHTSKQRIFVHFGQPKCDKLINHMNGITVVKVNSNNLHKVVEYDSKICDGLVRNKLLEEFTKVPETVFIAAINEINGDVNGYCITMKTNVNTALVQPLYADNEKIAELLIGKSCELMPIAVTNGIIMRSYDNNEIAKSLVNKLAINSQLLFYVMFTEREINFNDEKVFFTSTPTFYNF